MEENFNENNENLEIYISYDRLLAEDLASFLNNVAQLSNRIAKEYGKLTLDIEDLPTLDIEYLNTGNSIKMKLVGGWKPTITSDKENDIIIGVPKKIGISLLLAYFLISGANNYYDLKNKHLDSEVKTLEIINKERDNRLKEIELKLKEMEIKIKESELGKLTEPRNEEKMTLAENLQSNIPESRELISKTVREILENEHFEKFEVNGVDIKNLNKESPK